MGRHPHALSLCGALRALHSFASLGPRALCQQPIRYYQLSMHFILASLFARRTELLTSAGFHFDIVPADVEETPNLAENPREYALRVARDKVDAVGVTCQDPGTVLLGADTVVVAAGEILGKPRDSEDARRMLRLLSGTAHDVLTAVVVTRQALKRTEVVTTRVWFQPLDDSEIAWYADSGEPDGKAGAYAIQGRAARFIERIDGSWSNVVGLPVATVYRLLKGLQVVD